MLVITAITLGSQTDGFAQPVPDDAPTLNGSLRLDDDDQLPPAEVQPPVNAPSSGLPSSGLIVPLRDPARYPPIAPLSPSPSSATLSSPTPARAVSRGPEDPLDLQIELAESTFKLKPDYYSLSRLINVHERALAAYCQGFHGDREVRIAKCNRARQRLLTLDATNLPVVCDTIGLLSAECRELFAAQELGYYDVNTARWATLSESDIGKLEAADLSNAIEVQRRRPMVEQLSQRVSTLRHADNKDTEKREELKRVLIESIALTCASPKVIFLKPQAVKPGIGERRAGDPLAEKVELASAATPTPTPAPVIVLGGDGASLDTLPGAPSFTNPPFTNPSRPDTSKTTPTGGSFDDVIKGLQALPTIAGGAERKPSAPAARPSRLTLPTEKRIRRVRLLSSDCRDVARTALDIFPDLRQGLCARDGWYAPTCRAAQFSDQAQPDGMSSF